LLFSPKGLLDVLTLSFSPIGLLDNEIKGRDLLRVVIMAA